MIENQALFEFLGTIGGICGALSLVPQVIQTYETKSAKDISYIYQWIYIAGCTLTNTYALALNLWPIYVPGLIEQFLIVLLTVMKYVYDKEDKRKSMELKLKEEGIEVIRVY